MSRGITTKSMFYEEVYSNVKVVFEYISPGKFILQILARNK